MANNEQERDAWLAQVSEAALEPELPIVDPHHHLWDHPGSRYMLDEIVRDTASGHRVLATVFVECLSMYRADGPEPMRPVGETEFVNGIAAQSASGQCGETRVAAGIVGFADLTLGAAVEPVLQAHIVVGQLANACAEEAATEPAEWDESKTKCPLAPARQTGSEGRIYFLGRNDRPAC